MKRISDSGERLGAFGGRSGAVDRLLVHKERRWSPPILAAEGAGFLSSGSCSFLHTNDATRRPCPLPPHTPPLIQTD